MRAPHMPYSVRDRPIITANAQGPSRSPIALGTFRPVSANREAHWDIPCSDAPAHTIIKRNSQIILLFSSARSGVWCSSPASVHSGTRANSTMLHSGSTAHSTGSSAQRPVPANAKYRVDSTTTPTWPQQ